LTDSKQQTYLITGATGSLGSSLTQYLLSQGHKVRAFARNEHGHQRLWEATPKTQQANLSCLLGSVEDLERLRRACKGATRVIHAAAQKIISTGEHNPSEVVKTNILGTMNVIDAAIDCGVSRAVFVSSDKAAASVNHYGHTKAVGEKLWIHANRYDPMHQPFVAVRYGNCWNSKGSVIQSFQAQMQYGYLTLTSGECTRFHWLLEDAVRFVLHALEEAKPGELWVPKLPAYKLFDLAYSFMDVAGGDWKEPVLIGLRPGEKLHESMIANDEAFMAREDGVRYIITPGQAQKSPLSGGYHSSTPTRLGKEALRTIIRETIL
jgi:FlaA1/EpsC-like NDP-sugar epimerase